MVQRCSDFQHCVPRYQLGFWSWVVFSTLSFFGNSLDLSVIRVSKTLGPERLWLYLVYNGSRNSLCNNTDTGFSSNQTCVLLASTETAFIQKDRGTNLTTSGSKRLPPHAAPKMQFEMSPALELVLRWACFRSPPDKCLPAAKHAKTLKLHRFTPVRQAKSHGWPPVLLSDSAWIYFLLCAASIQIGDLVGVPQNDRIKAQSSLVGGVRAFEVCL